MTVIARMKSERCFAFAVSDSIDLAMSFFQGLLVFFLPLFHSRSETLSRGVSEVGNSSQWSSQ